jgi:hypothetical protein
MTDSSLRRLTPEKARELTEQWTRLYASDGMDVEAIVQAVREVLTEYRLRDHIQ